MTKQKLLLLFIAVCTIWNSTKAQSYTIESLEGAKVKIHLKKMPSWYDENFSCLTDTLFLNDYGGAEEIHVLKRKFLEIVYYTRGGSGFQLRQTIILCVNRNKINAALIATSFTETFGGDKDGTRYIVKFNITGNDNSNFKLIARIYERPKSSLHLPINYIKKKKVILNFDPNQNIFYSSHKSIKHSFTIDAREMQQPEKWEINEMLPMAFLDDETHYYIKGKWYSLGYDDTLFEEYYKNHLYSPVKRTALPK